MIPMLVVIVLMVELNIQKPDAHYLDYYYVTNSHFHWSLGLIEPILYADKLKLLFSCGGNGWLNEQTLSNFCIKLKCFLVC